MNRIRSIFAGSGLLALSVVLSTQVLSGATPGFQYTIISITNTMPGQFPVIRFMVTDPNNGNIPYDIQADPAWRAPDGASRLFLHIGWSTTDYSNTRGHTETALLLPALGLPFVIDALALTVTSNFAVDGSFQATAELPVPATATGTGVVLMEGHPAGPDPITLLYTVRIPVKSVYKYFTITGGNTVAPALSSGVLR